MSRAITVIRDDGIGPSIVESAIQVFFVSFGGRGFINNALQIAKFCIV